MVNDLYPTRKFVSSPTIMERKDPIVYGDKILKDSEVLSQEKLKFFEDNGYLFFPNFFSTDEITTFHSILEKLAHDENLKKLSQFIIEPESRDVRSIFEVHKLNPVFQKLSRDKRIVNIIKQILDSEVYITQSRINRKPGFEGKEFYWHSDFETWHAEDGMPRMRAVSCSINLTENFEFNGPLMVIPGSHKFFIPCVGHTPDDHYKYSLKKQEIGTPDHDILTKLAKQYGINTTKGPPGSALFFDCNIMHGSGGNITPFPRSNIFFVYNSVHNALQEPFCCKEPRPNYIAARKVETVVPQ